MARLLQLRDLLPEPLINLVVPKTADHTTRLTDAEGKLCYSRIPMMGGKVDHPYHFPEPSSSLLHLLTSQILLLNGQVDPNPTKRSYCRRNLSTPAELSVWGKG
jgi:hypothetical protein